jgi:diguanylate cyclase (GGDEF)-like protein
MIDRTTGLYTLGQFEQDILNRSDVSLALFKINDFKNLNDFYGYEVGNSILRQSADFLREMISGLDDASLYRISGTHFALLIPMNSYDLERFARLTIYMFEEREIQIETEFMYLEMAIGIVDRRDEISLSNADIALREAERLGRVVVYTDDKSKDKLRSDKLKCKDDIKRALKEDRFHPYYQPIIDNHSKKIIKYEALARLVMPEGEIITPAFFLSVAKETKTYNQISQMIIQKAMDDFRDSECKISINLSINDIKNPMTRKFIFKKIEEFPEPERLVFELLESEGIDSYDELGHFLNRIKHYGCKIAIDDFGSGYSNFEHLAKLNIDYIKIDGSLIVNIEKEFLSQTIVETIASFAKKINVKTVAEFVGNKSVESMLVSMGVTESQGYLFGQAIPYNPSMRFIQSL